MWIREKEEDATAEFIEAYANFLECHIEIWTVTTETIDLLLALSLVSAIL